MKVTLVVLIDIKHKKERHKAANYCNNEWEREREQLLANDKRQGPFYSQSAPVIFPVPSSATYSGMPPYRAQIRTPM